MWEGKQTFFTHCHMNVCCMNTSLAEAHGQLPGTHLRIINRQLATAVFGCGHNFEVLSSVCSSQTATWALAKTSKHFFYIYVINGERNCCYCNYVCNILLIRTLFFISQPLSEHSLEGGQMKQDKERVLIEQVTVS